MKDRHMVRRAPLLIRWGLIGVALECLYLLVYALAPIATVYPQVFPLGRAWASWTLLNDVGGINRAPPGLYYLLGIIFLGLGGVYLYAVISASRMGAGDQGDRKGPLPASSSTPALTMTTHQPDTGRERVITGWLLLPLIGAVVFGITLLFVPAIFSNDIFRYISASHMPNIYYGPPFSTLVAQFPQTPNNSGTVTLFSPVLYGPLWVGIAGAINRAPTQASSDLVTIVLLFRGLALLVHLINCVLVWAILSKIALARRLSGTLLYAWNPLVLIELVVNGHNDGVAICLLLLAVWFYVQQRGEWFEVTALLCCGLAISVNLMVLLIMPLLLWFMVRNEQHIARAILSSCWRALFVLAIMCIFYAPVWQGGVTFLAIVSSIDMQNFLYSFLALLVTPLSALYSQLTGGISLPSSLLQPVLAADTTILASTIFIFALLYFQAMGRVRKDTTINTTGRDQLRPYKGAMIEDSGRDKSRPYDVLFTSWTVVILGFVVLASTLFWPWYIVWVVWIVALRRFDALTVAVLLLSCTALLYYPFLHLDTTPAGIYVPLCIFGVPFVYLIAQRYLPLKQVFRSLSSSGGRADVGRRPLRAP